MTTVDRAVHRLSRHLVPGEVVVTSLMAVEDGGHRRQTVVLTDRRVLVAPRRGGPGVELGLGGCGGTYEVDGGRLTLTDGTVEVALRDVEEAEGRGLLDLLARRGPARADRDQTAGGDEAAGGHVRVLPE